MNRYILSSILLLIGCVAIWGCSSSAPGPAQPAPAGTQHDAHNHARDEHAAGQPLSEEVLANFAELSPEDRSLAEHQKVCPVSDEPLGSMGAPIKVDVNGQPVFICCEGCKEELLTKPDEYLAKLKN